MNIATTSNFYFLLGTISEMIGGRKIKAQVVEDIKVGYMNPGYIIALRDRLNTILQESGIEPKGKTP